MVKVRNWRRMLWKDVERKAKGGGKQVDSIQHFNHCSAFIYIHKCKLKLIYIHFCFFKMTKIFICNIFFSFLVHFFCSETMVFQPWSNPSTFRSIYGQARVMKLSNYKIDNLMLPLINDLQMTWEMTSE